MTYIPNDKIDTIVLHYSATPIERNFTAADIDRMHKARGWKGIGYHYFIRKDGTREYGRDMTKPDAVAMGAHVYGHNQHTVGVCVEGGVTLANPNLGFDSRTPAQKAELVKLVDELLERFPGAKVVGHRDMPGNATQCPGYDAAAWWQSVKDDRAAWEAKTLSKPSTPRPGGLLAALIAILKALGGRHAAAQG